MTGAFTRPGATRALLVVALALVLVPAWGKQCMRTIKGIEYYGTPRVWYEMAKDWQTVYSNDRQARSVSTCRAACFKDAFCTYWMYQRTFAKVTTYSCKLYNYNPPFRSVTEYTDFKYWAGYCRP